MAMDLTAILAELARPGRALHRPNTSRGRLDSYYIHDGTDYVSGTRLSVGRVRRLERDGVIVHVGEFRYALTEGR